MKDLPKDEALDEIKNKYKDGCYNNKNPEGMFADRSSIDTIDNPIPFFTQYFLYPVYQIVSPMPSF